MMELKENLEKISSIIISYTARGLPVDKETFDFIRSAYGISSLEEITVFIACGDECGTITDLVSYPDDSLRESIEKLIPARGLSFDDIHAIENLLISSGSVSHIIISSRKIILSEENSLLCRRLILKRLNLDIPFDMIDLYETEDENFSYNKVKSLLRKKKFKAAETGSIFMNDLIFNYTSLKIRNYNEFILLLETACGLLSGSDKKPFDILSEKKYFYENAIMQAEEFSLLMKTYSMEFIMMKRIQPPLITIEEARSNIKLIDRMTSIAYGMVIPSVNNVVIDGF